jgi:hypothetical protein
MDSISQNLSKLEKVRSFIKNNSSYFSLDKMDFRRSKLYASGSGFILQGNLNKAWGESRATACVDALTPIVDSTCNAFMRNPFSFDNVGEELSLKLNEVFNDCLREACQDGLSFMYVWHDENSVISVRRINNMHVMWAETEAVVIDKQKIERSGGGSASIWANLDALNLGSDEIPIVTHFILKDGVVEITKIKDEEIVGETELRLPHLPIIPVRGRQVFLTDNEVHWRGYYYPLRDVLSALNANLSVSLERMITRDPVLLANESLGDSEYTKQWEENGTRNFYVYEAFMPKNEITGESGQPIPPPILNPQVNDISKLEAVRTSLFEIIDRVTGSNYLSESKGAETATQVLLRNQNKEDALSQILLNLTNAARRTAKVLMAYYEDLGYGLAGPINVKDNVSEGIKNTNSLQLLLSIKDLPVNVQLAVMKTYDAPKEIISSVEREALDRQGDPEKQEMAAAIQQMTHQLQLEQLRSKEAEATYEAARIEAMQRYETKMEELRVEREIKIAQLALEREKLALEYAKLGLKKEEAEAGLEIKAAEQSRKDVELQAEIIKTASADTVHAVV